MAESSGRKTKEQKRMEAEARQARYRQEQEQKRKGDILKKMQESESLLLSELRAVCRETHQDATRVAELSRRLGDIQKQIKNF